MTYDLKSIDCNYVLPSQVGLLFKNATVEELEIIAGCYTGKNESPSFQEWLESYQQNKLLQNLISFNTRGVAIKVKLDEQEKLIESSKDVVDSVEFKKLDKERRRLQSLFDSNQSWWFNVNNSLAKMVQETLKREAPKVLNVNNTFSVNPQQLGQFLQHSEDELDLLEADVIDESDESK